MAFRQRLVATDTNVDAGDAGRSLKQQQQQKVTGVTSLQLASNNAIAAPNFAVLPSPSSAAVDSPSSSTPTALAGMTERQQLRWLMRQTSEPDAKQPLQQHPQLKKAKTKGQDEDEDLSESDDDDHQQADNNSDNDDDEDDAMSAMSESSSSSAASSRQPSPERQRSHQHQQQQQQRPSMLRSPHSATAANKRQEITAVNDHLPRAIRLPLEFALWSKDKQTKWCDIWRNPNAFYYSYLPPGVRRRQQHGQQENDENRNVNGTTTTTNDDADADLSWTPAEVNQLLYALLHHPPTDAQLWGLFSLNVPGRTGRECEHKARQLLKEGVVVAASEDGQPIATNSKAKQSASKGRQQQQPLPSYYALASQSESRYKFDSTPLLVIPAATTVVATAITSLPPSVSDYSVAIARVVAAPVPGTEKLKAVVRYDVAGAKARASINTAVKSKDKDKEKQSEAESNSHRRANVTATPTQASSPPSSSLSLSRDDSTNEANQRSGSAKRKLAATIQALPSPSPASSPSSSSSPSAQTSPSSRQNTNADARTTRGPSRRELKLTSADGSGGQQMEAGEHGGGAEAASAAADIAAGAALNITIASTPHRPLLPTHLVPTTAASDRSTVTATATTTTPRLLPFAQFSIPAHTPYYPASPAKHKITTAAAREAIDAKRRRLLAPVALEGRKIEQSPAVQRNDYPSPHYTPLARSFETSIDVSGKLVVQHTLSPPQQHAVISMNDDDDNNVDVTMAAEKVMHGEGGGGVPLSMRSSMMPTAASAAATSPAIIVVNDDSNMTLAPFASSSLQQVDDDDAPQSFDHELLLLEQRHRVALRKLANWHGQSMKAIASYYGVRNGSVITAAQAAIKQEQLRRPFTQDGNVNSAHSTIRADQSRRPFMQPRNTFAAGCRRGLQDYFNNPDATADNAESFWNRCPTYHDAVTELRNVHRTLLREVQREHQAGRDVLVSLRTTGLLQ